jgi:hypothetical protein
MRCCPLLRSYWCGQPKSREKEKYRHLAKASSRFNSNGIPLAHCFTISHSVNKQNLANLATAMAADIQSTGPG